MADKLGEAYSFEPANSRRTSGLDERTSVSYAISIDGVDLKTIGLGGAIHSISIEESIGDMMKLCATLHFEDRALFNENIFRVGNPLFIGVKHRDEQDSFYGILKSHKVDYFAGRITLTALGSESILHESEKRRQWKNITSTGIFQKIVEEYGIELSSVEDNIIHECRNQINKTDYEFLRELSFESGYDFYFDGGRFWYVPIGVRQTDRVFTDLPLSDVSDFCAKQVERSTLTATHTYLDINTKTQYLMRSRGSSDVDAFLGEKEFETESARLLSNQQREDKQKYVIDMPIPKNRDLVSKLLESLCEDSRFIIEAGLETTYGIGIKPRDIISVVGFGRWGGRYMVTEVSHRVKNGMQTYLGLARTYSGSFTSSLYKKANITRSFSNKEQLEPQYEKVVRTR